MPKPMHPQFLMHRVQTWIGLVCACTLVMGCGAPKNTELCDVAAELSKREFPKREINERFTKLCMRKVQNLRLDAGVLRFGVVARCMKEAETSKDFYACGVDDKPPPRH